MSSCHILSRHFGLFINESCFFYIYIFKASNLSDVNIYMGNFVCIICNLILRIQNHITRAARLDFLGSSFRLRKLPVCSLQIFFFFSRHVCRFASSSVYTMVSFSLSQKKTRDRKCVLKEAFSTFAV